MFSVNKISNGYVLKNAYSDKNYGVGYKDYNNYYPTKEKLIDAIKTIIDEDKF